MKPLRDASGKTIGYENDVSDFRQEIRDRSGGLLGHYWESLVA